MSDGIKLILCPNCEGRHWIADGMGDWIRCEECNPPPPPKHKAEVLTFSRGAKVRKQVTVDNDLPPAA